ncbi:MAG: SCO family protein [Myxococcales bacterium]|nr:SCO family protein [Myxococcales bacterium]
MVPSPRELNAGARWLFSLVLLLGLGAGPISGCRKTEPLPEIARVPVFALRDQDGETLTAKQLYGKVWVANFIFTSCPDVCPLLTGKMRTVRTKLAKDREQLRFVSFSVDPAHDTPEVLQAYAREHGVDQPDWRFLTGPLDEIREVVVGGFKQSLQDSPAEQGTAEGKTPGKTPDQAANIMHGSHFVLVDKKLQIRGFYSSDQDGMLRLARDARRLLAEADAAGES